MGENRGVSSYRRALVLGSGGATGIAWEAGVLAGLVDAGVSLDAELVVGTSAGALVAARLTTGWTTDQLYAAMGAADRAGRAGPAALARLLAAQVYPSRRHAVAWLGRRAAASWSSEAELRWIEALAPDLSGRDWPASLVVVATDVASGHPAYFSAAHPTDLALAVAASCAMPGVFPAVRVAGRLHFDGGLRSPLNLDVAAGVESVIALAPLSGSVRPHRRPAEQVKALDAAVALLRPDAAARRAIGLDLLDPRRGAAVAAAGRAQGIELGARLGGEWPRR